MAGGRDHQRCWCPRVVAAAQQRHFQDPVRQVDTWSSCPQRTFAFQLCGDHYRLSLHADPAPCQLLSSARSRHAPAAAPVQACDQPTARLCPAWLQQMGAPCPLPLPVQTSHPHCHCPFVLQQQTHQHQVHAQCRGPSAQPDVCMAAPQQSPARQRRRSRACAQPLHLSHWGGPLSPHACLHCLPRVAGCCS